MNKFIMAAMLLALSATSAMACDGPQPKGCNCDPKTNQWVTTVNGVNGNISAGATAGATASSTAGATATNTSNNTNNNNNVANGGQGGKGGNATATGGSANATGGSATIAKGAVTNNNNVSQSQGQTQFSTSNVTNSGNSTVSNSGNATVGNVGSTSSVGNVSTGASTSDASASNNGNGSNNTQINYSAPKIPVATAYAASLTSGLDTCLGSTSGGVQTQILGLSLGGTHVDKNCVLIKQTNLLREMNQDRAACFRMQMGKEGEAIRQAMKDAGAECPPLVAPVAVVVQPLPPADAVTHGELAEVEKRIVTKVTQK